jgi:acyl carrier protein
MATIFHRVRTVIVDRLGIDEDRVVAEAVFVDDLSADSLDLLEVIVGIEEEFDGEYAKGGKRFEITDEQAKKIRTIADVVNYLKLMGIADN